MRARESSAVSVRLRSQGWSVDMLTVDGVGL